MKIIFDEDEAIKYGLKKAIILDAIRLLIIETEGITEAGSEIEICLDYKSLYEKLPFLSLQTIKKHVESLISQDVLILTDDNCLSIRNEFADEDFESEAVSFLLKRAQQ